MAFRDTPSPQYSIPLKDQDSSGRGTPEYPSGLHDQPGFPNAHFSRYSAASGLTASPSMASANAGLMGRSDSAYTVNDEANSAANILPQDGAPESPRLAGEPIVDMGEFGSTNEKPGGYGSKGGYYGAVDGAGGRRPASRRRKLWIWLGVILAAVVIIAVVLGAALGTTLNKGNRSGASGAVASASSSTRASSASSPQASASAVAAQIHSLATTGTNGSTVYLSDGSNMTYINNWGGRWQYDQFDIFNNGAQAQSWTPALNETFTFGVDKVRGVNLGGWLNTEPFICPGLYDPYISAGAVDESSLMKAMGADGPRLMQEHYETFITEADFMEIAAAGLNFVRIPIGYWAIEVLEGEPFLPLVSWQYFLKAIGWARKYGLRINLDLHAVPGSENGWNHSGEMAEGINWLYGSMGMANAQRSLNYIRTLAQFISQPQYKDVVPFFGIVNEPYAPTIGTNIVQSFYTEAYRIVREVTGTGAGNGPYILFHDGFAGVDTWSGFMSGSDRVQLDTHTYLVFQVQDTTPLSGWPVKACNAWANSLANSMTNFGFTASGEFSGAVNDCGQWVNGVGDGTRWEGAYPGYSSVYNGNCSVWTDYRTWNATFKQEMQNWVLASMDALGNNYFFWTWKIGNSTSKPDYTPNPMWHYKLGYEQGWFPSDPRQAEGVCASLGTYDVWNGTLQSWMTGGSGAGQTISSTGTWPPATLGPSISAAQITRIPQLTMTGTPITMPGPTYTTPGSNATFNAGNGWFNAQNTQAAYAYVDGCSYPTPWLGASVTLNGTQCGAGPIATAIIKRDPSPAPQPTSPPIFV